MPVPDLVDGHLPPGRWACTAAEVEAKFVGTGDPREPIWADWLALTAALRRTLGNLPAAWLSGSFFTDRPVPADIDCVYVADTEDVHRITAAGGADYQLLWVIASSQTKTVLNLNVDSYILEWAPAAGPQRSSPATYYRDRGYWDDLWVRIKDSDSRLDSIPRRGYLEVTLDGYR